MNKIKEMYNKYKELIVYVIFGVLTTVVNYVVYFALVDLLHVNYLISNGIAWVVAVIFAFLTNKVYVFNSKSWGVKTLLREGILFAGARVLSGVMETAMLYVFVEHMRFDNGIVKIVAGILVIIINYVLSKLVIFRKKQ